MKRDQRHALLTAQDGHQVHTTTHKSEGSDDAA